LDFKVGGVVGGVVEGRGFGVGFEPDGAAVAFDEAEADGVAGSGVDSATAACSRAS